MEVLRRIAREATLGALYASSIFSQVHEDNYWNGNVRVVENLGHRLEITVDCRRESLDLFLEGKIERTGNTPYPDSVLTIKIYEPDPGELAKINVPSTLSLPRNKTLAFWLSEPSGANSQLLTEFKGDCSSTNPLPPDLPDIQGLFPKFLALTSKFARMI